jgi:hypothetical protein
MSHFPAAASLAALSFLCALASAPAIACTHVPPAPHGFPPAERGGGINAPGFVSLADRTPVIHGIDVSVVENDTNFARAYECGARFAYVRLSEGARDTEPLYRTNWGAARASGLVPGPFHRLTFAGLAPDGLANLNGQELQAAIDEVLPRAEASGREQVAVFLERLREVRSYDPGRRDDPQNPKPPYLQPALAVNGDPVRNGSPEVRRAFGRAYTHLICTWIRGLREGLQQPDAPVSLIIDPQVYSDYGFQASGCGLEQLPVVVVHRPADGNHFDATSDAAQAALIRSICGYAPNRNRRANRAASRCRFDNYASRGAFAAFAARRSPNLDRFFGTQEEFNALLRYD